MSETNIQKYLSDINIKMVKIQVEYSVINWRNFLPQIHNLRELITGK